MTVATSSYYLASIFNLSTVELGEIISRWKFFHDIDPSVRRYPLAPLHRPKNEFGVMMEAARARFNFSLAPRQSFFFSLVHVDWVKELCSGTL
jgi:hypothetical protein